MAKINKLFWLFLLVFSIVTISGCNTDQSKNEDKIADKTNSGINAELLKEQNDLYEKVCQDFSDVNNKVVELNSKIRSMTGKLTEDQNKAIDEIEDKRNSIYTRMHGLKNVSSADWENFKITLEKDIEGVKTQVDEIIRGIK